MTLPTPTEGDRRYERVEAELPCRLFIPEGGRKAATGKDAELRFEAFCISSNMGLGGVFVASAFLLRAGVELYVELGLPSGPLAVRARIAHTTELEDGSGMGLEFLDVDSHGRETLLRYFTPQRYQKFYGHVIEEFPHLKKDFAMPDVSLVVNLWEEWKIVEEGGPVSTASGAPRPENLKVRETRRSRR